MDEGAIEKSLERIGRILAGILLKDAGDDQTQKIALLKGCGFANVEIAKMLGTSANNVNVRVHSLRKRRRGKRRQRR